MEMEAVFNVVLALVLGIEPNHGPNLDYIDSSVPVAEAICAMPMCVFHPWVPEQPWTDQCPSSCTWYDGVPQVCTDPKPRAWDCTPAASGCWWDCDRIF